MLLEAIASACLAAMNTGGTTDIVKHDRLDSLSSTPEALAADVRRLVDESDATTAAGATLPGITRSVHSPQTSSLRRVESLYMDLMSSARTRGRERGRLVSIEIRAIRVPSIEIRLIAVPL